MKRTFFYLIGLLTLSLSLALAGCGEEATPVAVNSTVAVANLATSAIATTVAVTSAPSTTSAPTTKVPTMTLLPDPKLPYLVIGNPAHGGSLRSPRDGVVDGKGNLFVADYATRKVVKFDQNNQFKQFIEFDPTQPDPGGPSYLAVDGPGNLYVAYFSGVVVKFDQTGKQTGFFGDKELGGVYSIATDKVGNVYTITSQDYLVKYGSDSKVLSKFQANKKTGDKLDDGQFNYSARIRVGADGAIYLFDQYEQARVQRFDSEMKFVRAYSVPAQKDGKPSQVADLLPEVSGDLLVVNYEHVWKFDNAGKLLSDNTVNLFNPTRLLGLKDGSYIVVGGSANETGKLNLAAGKIETIIGRSNADQPGQFETASSIVVDKAANFYVGDPYKNRIQKFDKTGKLVLTIDEKVAGNNLAPEYLALDQGGNIYVAGNSSLTKLDATGHQTLSFGKYGKEEGQFEGLSGLALDKDGNIYVGDSQRGVIQKFSPSGAYQASFSIKIKESDKDMTNEISIVIDSAGNLYVGRGYDNGILVMDPSGKSKGQLNPNNKLVRGAGITALALDTTGTVYAATTSSEHPILIISKDGQVKGSYGSEGLQTLQFLNLHSIAVDEGGNLYLAETDGARVQRWNPQDTTVKPGAVLEGGR